MSQLTLPHFQSRRDCRRASRFDEEAFGDFFAGGGGASVGAEEAMGRAIDFAVNHDRHAIEMHQVNHPRTRHFREDVWHFNVSDALRGRKLGGAWFSPDCKHFSRAKGKPLVSQKIRGLAWIVIRVARRERPRVIWLENVAEFQTWGPLIHAKDAHGNPLFDTNGGRVMMPDKSRSGETFRKWMAQLRSLGYHVEWRELRTSDYDSKKLHGPTIRKRLYLIARCDGKPITWPKPTMGNPKGKDFKKRRLKPWHTAAECIDWSIECPSIFTRKKALKDATHRRIASGLIRFTINSSDPFIVNLTHGSRVEDVNEPMQTVTGANRGEKSVVSAFVAKHFGGVVGVPASDPFPTITARGTQNQIVAASLVQTGYGERKGQSPRCLDIEKPLGTVVADGQKHALIAASLVRSFGQSLASSIDNPMPTTTSGGGGKTSLVTATLVNMAHSGTNEDIQKPLSTIATEKGGCRAVVSAHLSAVGGRAGQSNPTAADQPLGTITAKADRSIVSAHLIGAGGPTYSGKPVSVDQPIGALTTENHRAIIAAHLTKLYGTCRDGQSLNEPAPTTTASSLHTGLVSALIAPYYKSGSGTTGRRVDEPAPTVTVTDRLSLITAALESAADEVPAGFWRVWDFLKRWSGPDAPPPIVFIKGELYFIVDIGMRMLTPRELARAQGFPDSYILTGTKTQQVARIGNSVCPVMAYVLVKANYKPQRVPIPSPCSDEPGRGRE